MSDKPISQREFDQHVKRTTRAIEKIATSFDQLASDGQENNRILREYIITNNNKHDQTANDISRLGNRVTNIALNQKEDRENLANLAKVTNIISPLKWLFVLAIGAAATTYGGYQMKAFLDNKKPEIQKPKIEVLQ